MPRSKYFNDDTPTPTCAYFYDRPCARPKECPTHGPVLARSTKKLHYLRAQKVALWEGGEVRYWRTVCGEYLHARIPWHNGIDYDHNERPPVVSSDPAYEVFRVVGTSVKECLVATTSAPSTRMCVRCLRSGLPHIYPNHEIDAN